ncbi:hypothetical protein FRB93_000484 [Tulasnella sp. JGI-2019a]|nr:hypothetical protein FRB93_000484 [Tulasnella sp. JGI-2019a]
MTASFADHVPAPALTLASVASVDSPLQRLLRLAYLESHALICLFFFVTGILLLAHTTNPTEASFRTFLTELAFRRHLTKLNGTLIDLEDKTHTIGEIGGPGRIGPCTEHAPTTTTTIGPVYHFAKGVQVTLRTPVNIVRSFAFFTIVIITPVSDLTRVREKNAPTPTVMEGTWYIGALGHWWVGGTVDLPRFTRHGKKELLGKEEGAGLDLKAGLLGFLCLDNLCAPDSPSSSTAPLAIKQSEAKSSKVKRRRSLARHSNPNLKASALPPRSTTPPPLPESASLPLHSVRMPPAIASNQVSPTKQLMTTPTQQQPQPQKTSVAEEESIRQARSASHLAMIDQSPAVVEVLKQLSTSQASISDLRSQLTILTTTSTTQHQALQATLQSHRGKKQQDDQARNDLKAKMKGFDDAKRAAETSKREAEKRLKAVQVKHDATLSRIDRLSEEIQGMQKTISNDEGRAMKSCMEASTAEAELMKTMEQKKKELKVAGDVVNALTQRAKEYEEKLKTQQEKLAMVKETAEDRHRKRMAVLQQQQQQHRSSNNNANSATPNAHQLHARQTTQPPQGNPNSHPSLHRSGSDRDKHTSQNDLLPQQPFMPPTNFGPVYTMGSQPYQPPAPMSIVQRRNVAEPERLLVPMNYNEGNRSGDLVRTPSNSRNRQRAASLSGNGGVTVDTTGAPGFTVLGHSFPIRGKNGSSGRVSQMEGMIGQNYFGGSTSSLDKPSPPPSIGRQNSGQSQRGSTFSPFSDGDSLDSFSRTAHNSNRDSNSSMSTFATSLLPTSLVESLDGDRDSTRSSVLKPSPYLSYDAYNNGHNPFGKRGSGKHIGNSYGHGNGNGNGDYNTADSNYYQNGMATQQFSPQLSQNSLDPNSTSPGLSTSPRSVSGLSPHGRHVKFASNTLNHSRSFGSSQSSFEHYPSVSTPLETVDENRDAKHRRWFPSFINSQAGQLAVFPSNDSSAVGSFSGKSKSTSKSGLNPDAKSFSLSRGRSFLLQEPRHGNDSTTSLEASGSPPIDANVTQHPSLASRMYGSLTQTLHRHSNSQEQRAVQQELTAPQEPAPSTPTGNFFSSLLAFAPSPAERQALQRGLETAAAKSGLGGTGLGNGHARGSQDSLPTANAPWVVGDLSDRDASSSDNLPLAGATITPASKRPLSSLWSRNKSSAVATTKSVIINEEPEVEKHEAAAATVKNEAAGSRLVRFGKHSQKTSIESMGAGKSKEDE